MKLRRPQNILPELILSFHDVELGCQAWLQAPLMAKPAHNPKKQRFLSNILQKNNTPNRPLSENANPK